MSLRLTLAVAGTWCVIAAALAALGVAFLHRLGGARPSWRHALFGVWAGHALLLMVLSAWHLLLPIDSRALAVVALAATGAFIFERHWFRALLRLPVSRTRALLVLALVLWVANHALGSTGMDDYNYEFQAIRWVHDHPIVPGLANLHARLALNNAHHLFGALISVGPWVGAVNHVFNGLFVVLALLFLGDGLVRTARASGPLSAQAFFRALLVAPCAGLVLFGIYGPMLSTLKADVFVSVSCAVAACLFVEFAAMRSEDADADATVSTLLLVAAAIAGVKLTGAFFAGALCLAAFGRLVLRPLSSSRAAIASVCLTAAFVAVMLARAAILSGYPLYPLTVLSIDADWRVPEAQARAIHAYVTSWAQLRPTYDPAMVGGWDWFRPWARATVQTDRFTIVLPLLLAVGCVPLLSGRRGAPEPAIADAVPAWAGLLLAGISAVAVVLWFLQAPSGRFGFIYFWIGLACLLTWTLQHRRLPAGPVILGAAVVTAATGILITRGAGVSALQPASLLVAVFSGCWIAALAASVAAGRRRAIAGLCALLALAQPAERLASDALHGRAGARSLFWLDVDRLGDRHEAPAAVVRQTRSGVTVYEVKESRYDTPLPNTRFFNPGLELRHPPHLRGGFRNPSGDISEYQVSVDLPGWTR